MLPDDLFENPHTVFETKDLEVLHEKGTDKIYVRSKKATQPDAVELEISSPKVKHPEIHCVAYFGRLQPGTVKGQPAFKVISSVRN